MTNTRLLLIVFLALLALVSCGGGTIADRPAPQPPPSGFELFRQKCSGCHDLDRALKATTSKDAWLATIRRMREEYKADISGEEVERLVEYHMTSQQREAIVFEEKCQKCHPGRIFLEKNLTPEQTRTIIRTMQEKAGNTITDGDVELIVNYHRREHRNALQRNLAGAFGREPVQERSESMAAVVLFMDKCSGCHVADVALSVLKDERVWKKTINKMQTYSKGTISDSDAEKLVDFHVDRQRQEIETYQNTCTFCHDDKRIVRKSMTSEEWLATLRKMQQKAPDLITDDKITLLASYLHRREMVTASIFLENCRLCHRVSDTFETTVSPASVGILVRLADEKFTDDVSYPAVEILLRNHSRRQQRQMQVFEKPCAVCHEQDDSGRITNEAMRTKKDWALFITSLEGVTYTPDMTEAVGIQINYHVIRQPNPSQD